MSDRVETISFRTRRQKNDDRRARREAGLRQTHPARVARLLAQAHDVEARVEAGEFRDYADVARHHGLTRARLTQVMNLLLLAPDIQAEVLALRFPPGREPVTERHLRQVLRSPVWAEQRAVWAQRKSELFSPVPLHNNQHRPDLVNTGLQPSSMAHASPNPIDRCRTMLVSYDS